MPHRRRDLAQVGRDDGLDVGEIRRVLTVMIPQRHPCPGW